jgi:hypothetical protein
MEMTRLWGVQAVLLACACVAAPAFAADYVFAFEPSAASIDLDRRDNRLTFDAMLALLADFHGASGFQFTLVGADPGHCAGNAHCDAADLLVRRVNAIVAQIDQRKDRAALATDLKWALDSEQLVAPDIVRLQIVALDAGALSPQCPYVLELNDPRLPPVVGHKDWVSVQGLTEIRVTAASAMRVHPLNPAAGGVPLRALTASGVAELGSKGPQARLMASELLSSANVADLEMGPPAPVMAQRRTRDVAPDSEPWPTEDTQRVKETAEVITGVQGCAVRLMLTN